ncbi:MAG TPA: 3-deoxy-8-phosphooctulonate synthase, partial [Bacteroidales bacterium]|nr:3-deoxy-8-phosphooctulonate synthase [Bacteroidales bacterium]
MPLLKHLESGNFFLLAGPCVIEDETSPFAIAAFIKKITDRLAIPFVFKASYRKANRSSAHSFQGIGDENALKILAEIREQYQVPVVTDVHSVPEAEMAAAYVDILQIPAFLCRQTDLLQAAGRTGKTVNIKKGQFVSGEAMQFAVEKVRETGNPNILLTERGSTFGYN